MQVVRFIPQLLYLWGKRLQYSVDRRLGRPQSWSGHGKQKNLYPYQESNQFLVVQPVASHYTHWAILTPSSWFFDHGVRQEHDHEWCTYRIWRSQPWLILRDYFGMSGILAKIWTRCLINTSFKYYYYTMPLINFNSIQFFIICVLSQ
jgi:hypothetical protein